MPYQLTTDSVRALSTESTSGFLQYKIYLPVSKHIQTELGSTVTLHRTEVSTALTVCQHGLRPERAGDFCNDNKEWKWKRSFINYYYS